jgi:hypothetical protein
MQKARRRKRAWIVAAIVLLPVVLILSYVGSIGAIVFVTSTGKATSVVRKVPDAYYQPLQAYTREDRPGALAIMMFLGRCEWAGGSDLTWDEYWVLS